MLVSAIDFSALMLVLMMSGAGFFSGLTMPSRDVIVRQVTPPGAYGLVFGFVSTGFNIAGIISPLIYGQFLDRGYPREIFYFMGACALLSIITVAVSVSNRREA
jgi:MFS family permease